MNHMVRKLKINSIHIIALWTKLRIEMCLCILKCLLFFGELNVSLKAFSSSYFKVNWIKKILSNLKHARRGNSG